MTIDFAAELGAAFDHWRSLVTDDLLADQAESARANLHYLAEGDLRHLSSDDLERIAGHLSPGWAHTSGLFARVIYHSIWWANRRLLAAMFRLNWHGGKVGFQFLPDPAQTDPSEYQQAAADLAEIIHEGTDGDPRSILTGYDLAFFDSLPDRFTVYRGAAGISPDVIACGVCWTLRREVAEWFAHRSAGFNGGDPAVVSARVRKADVLFVKAEEFEIVMQPWRWRRLRCGAPKAQRPELTWGPPRR